MKPVEFVAGIGSRTIELLRSLGRHAAFFADLMRHVPAALQRFYLVTAQVHAIGNLSFLIIGASGLVVGLVLALQGYYTLSRYGAAEQLGLVVALSLLRELGPVVTALLFAGRAGTSLTAEIGLMKAGEQLSAMEMMAVDPVQRVVAPRFLAGFLAMPLLASIFAVMAIGVAGGHFIGVELLGVDEGAYWSQIHQNVEWRDIRDSLIKSLVFGAACSWIAVYQGYFAAPTSEGVSRATTSTVVVSSLAVLALDFILTAFMYR